MRKYITSLILGLAILGLVGHAQASLTLFNSFTGNELVSTDGCGSSTATCTMQSNIQAGSTIQAAYLYSSTFDTTTNPNGVTLGMAANTVTPTFTPLGVNGFLQAWRADVTSFVQANANIGSLTTWTVNEGANTSAIDGEALVVVYSNATAQLDTHTIAILNGFSSSSGDTSQISFTALPAGFTAQMMIGDGFSFDGPDPNNPTGTGQVSTITVNGISLTTVAGHCDDAQNATCVNGNLFTMGSVNAGSNDDPFTPFPCNGVGCVGSDHERYNLGNILAVGDTGAILTTVNPSGDDNIFLQVFDLSGTVTINPCPTPNSCSQVPEPSAALLLGSSLIGLYPYIRRRK
jgi:hypothetical protein